jgi:hypothetical protein
MGTLNLAALSSMHDNTGMITVEQLDKCGISRRLRQHLVSIGALVAVHRGVYRIASQPLTLEARCAALSLFLPDGYVTGPTGGKLFILRRMPTLMTKPATQGPTKHAKQGAVNHVREKSVEIIHYAVPHGSRIFIPGVQIRQTTIIEPTDVFERGDGIRLASPWRLAFDLAADLEALDHQSVVEQILERKLCTMVTLAHTARRLAHPNRPGSREFVTTLASRIPGGPLESHAEVVVAMALRDRGLPIVAQTTWLKLPNGRRVRLDISVPDVRWGVEVDIHPDHFLLFGTADRRRDRQCHQIGWQVDHVTAIDMLDVDAMIDELVANYQARVEEFAGRTA